MYVLAFLDRANIGFAKPAFQASTGVSEAAYALGAGLFFVTYALFEVPSNLILHRIGARRWLARIMVSWGLISAAMSLVRDEASFYLMRLLLGAAEAGFFPGVILYLTYWFPHEQRGRILGLFYFGAPIAFILGGPLSGLLLDLNGLAGLEGWQWMFLVEGLLAAAVGVWTWFYLTDRPADAEWLGAPERKALSAAIEAEAGRLRAAGRHTFFRALSDPRVLLFIAIYFLIQMSVYGVTFYLPTQVAKLMGRSVGLAVGLVTTVPWICAMAATLLLTRWADRRGAHLPLAVIALAASAVGIALSAQSPPLTALAALCLAAAGFISAQPLFWTFPTRYLAGVAAAGGFALINALGALGGFVAPNVKSWADGRFGSSAAGLYVLAGATALSAMLLLALRRRPAARAPAAAG
jgi:MFS family permease